MGGSNYWVIPIEIERVKLLGNTHRDGQIIGVIPIERVKLLG